MRTRFAPSPTGPLHLGHAFSALTAHDMARAAGGSFLLRIEDIDQSRARPEWEAQIVEDLHWLGLSWDARPLRQSDNMAAYDAALDALWARGLLYRCDCNRRDIAAAASAPQEGAPLIGPDGLVYPGTCREKHRRSGPRPHGAALRLDMPRACDDLTEVRYTEKDTPVALPIHQLIDGIGDVVLARREMGTSYHLSVVVDDAAQAITHVVRGEDLADATPIHRLLQILLGLPEPFYHHHRLIRDDHGKRLAKRDDARAIARYRADGASPADIRALVGL
ncbi:tRNA glutamyl-Q(34) synthetase GluQRS [Mesobacterium pallidum]|uniref:tRNA glutamyl-Q(34) synthetase GluQRS n=1 Tax=Mesobacterium pallidum TaxID=2872037 RepID=UPI001EE1C6F0|nr:tRNA glutamyl-Q(34) synthetase GluQRS [Mesobacterium pallidum]